MMRSLFVVKMFVLGGVVSALALGCGDETEPGTTTTTSSSTTTSASTTTGTGGMTGTGGTGGMMGTGGAGGAGGMMGTGGAGGMMGTGGGAGGAGGGGNPVINGCTEASAMDLTNQTMVSVSFSGTSYTPKCIKVSVGTQVTFNGSFASHPLVGGEVQNGMKVQSNSGPFIPATTNGMMKTFTMNAAGTYPYYCDVHALAGMTGVVYVQ